MAAFERWLDPISLLENSAGISSLTVLIKDGALTRMARKDRDAGWVRRPGAVGSARAKRLRQQGWARWRRLDGDVRSSL